MSYLKMAVLFSSLFLYTSFTMASDFKVVVSKSSSVKDLKISQIKAIFLGEHLYLEDGSLISPVIYADSTSSMHDLVQEITQLNYRAYTSLWRRKLFSGRGFPPKEISNKENLFSYFSQKETVVAVVPKSFIIDSSKYSVLN